MESIKEFPRGIAGVTATTKCSIGHPNGLSFGSTPPALDQVISGKNSTECKTRAPGPGLKRQASSSRRQAFEPTCSSIKPQATSPEAQASSFKPQAASSEIRVPLYKNTEEVFLGKGPRAFTMINVLSV